ncbi:MAG: hypothetical protein OXB88_00330 [Bacteriovoracales bacterium]|nr:hypothetical protein [Bacteriovoracales bacterium]
MKFFTLFFALMMGGDAFGVTETPYLVQILSENLKRYEQLREVIRSTKNTEHLLDVLNRGIDNTSGLLMSLPRKAESDFRRIARVYGSVPEGLESSLYSLHDRSVHRAVDTATAMKDYAKRLEKDAFALFQQAKAASLKGAQRMNVQANAQILQALNQLIRINSQILRLQSERLAFENKGGKDSARHFNKITADMEAAFRQFETSFKGPF